MSILRTHNLQNPDSSSINIVMDQGGNTNITGVTTVGGSNFHVPSGSVGIGTDNPQTKLDLLVGGSSGGVNIHNNATGSAFYQLSTTANSYKVESIGSDLRIYNNTSSSEKLRITSAGKIGISDTSPENTLSIKNIGSFEGDANSFYLGSNFTGTGQNFSGSGKHAQRFFFNNASGNGYLRYENTGATGNAGDAITWQERLRISSAGHVGINDNNPDTRLSVNSGATDVVAKFTSSDANAWIQFRDNTTTDTAVMVGANGNDLLLRSGSNERLRISSIGQLTTKGNNQGNPIGIEIRNNNSNAYSHAELSLTSQNATTSKIWCDVPNSGMRLNYNGGSSVKIDQSGNLHMPNGAGIDFSATANSSGSMGSELLDDYEEGSWTPVIDNLTNTPTYDNLAGRYTRIGRVVHLMGFIQINGTTTPTYSNESSAWSVSGLPYARSTTGACGYVAARGIVHGQNFQYNGSFNDYGTTGVVNIGFVSTTALGLYVTGSGNGTIRGQVRRSSMKNTFIIEFDIVYNA